MLGIAAVRGDRLRFALRDHAMFAALGLLLFSLNFLLFYHAAETLPSGLLSLVFSLASFINVWLGALFSSRRSTAAWSSAALLGTAGMAALFYPQFSEHALPQSALIALALKPRRHAALLLRQHGFRAHVSVAGCRSSRRPATACCMEAPGSRSIALIRGHTFTVEWTLPYLGGLIYLALIASVLAFACYLTLLGRIGADRAGLCHRARTGGRARGLDRRRKFPVDASSRRSGWSPCWPAMCWCCGRRRNRRSATTPPPARPPTDCRARR